MSPIESAGYSDFKKPLKYVMQGSHFESLSTWIYDEKEQQSENSKRYCGFHKTSFVSF